MGNAHHKEEELPDERTGLTKTEVKLIQETWSTFCSEHHEYGALLFISIFVKHPEYIQLFRPFRGKPITQLKEEPFFRAHGCAIGYHITSIVMNLQDPAIFEMLVRRNATEHLRRKGVKPYHFEVLLHCLVDVQQAKDENHLTPDAVEAWAKFITCMAAGVRDVFNKAAVERAERASMASVASRRTLDDATISTTFRTAVTTAGEVLQGLETATTSRTGDARGAATSTATDGAKAKLPPRIIGKKVDAAAAGKEAPSAKTGRKATSSQRRAVPPAAADREKSPAKDVVPHTEQAH